MNFLHQLKPGDKVIVKREIPTTSIPVIGTVSRCTKNLVVVSFKGKEVWKFKKSNGRLYGGSVYEPYFLMEATPERISVIKERQRRKRLKDNIKDFVLSDKLDKLTSEKLEAIAKLLV